MFASSSNPHPFINQEFLLSQVSATSPWPVYLYKTRGGRWVEGYMEQRGRKGGVRDSWDSLLMAINRLTVMTICDKSLGEESPKGFQPQPRQVWGFAKITQFWWPLKTGERWEMDQFLPSQRLKILPRGGGKKQPQITQQHGCPSSDEEGEKSSQREFPTATGYMC